MMHIPRQLLAAASTVLLACALAACSSAVQPSDANSASAPATEPGAFSTALAQPTALAVTTTASPVDAPKPRWRELGALASEGADGPTIAILAIDSTAPATLYAGTLYTAENRIGVYRSVDAGATWQPAGQGLPTSSDGTGVEGLLVDPQHPATIYATGHFNGIWRSDDSASHWRLIAFNNERVIALALDPHSSQVLYALMDDGPHRSTDSGVTWLHIGAGLPDRTSIAFSALLIDPQQPDTLYLGASFGGIFRSADAGEHWSPINTGIPSQPVLNGLALDPRHLGSLYASIVGAGLYRSIDSGEHWDRASEQEYLAISPAAEGALYAVLNNALARSTDSGTTWQLVTDVTCGVQSLASTPSGGIAAGCLDGRLYMLRSAGPGTSPTTAATAQPPATTPTAEPSTMTNTASAQPMREPPEHQS